MAISIDEFKKALIAFEEALTLEKTAITRDASIQRFEFTVELAWKTAKKVMGTATSAPKQVIREMAQSGLIDSVEIWLKAIDERNLAAHTYNEELADEVYSFAKIFIVHAKKLLERL